MESNDQTLVKFILDSGGNVNISDSSGRTPLHHACENGDVATVRTLLRNGADINTSSNKRFYPIHIAALNDHPEVIKVLIYEGKSKIECTNDENCTPLHLAAKKGFVGSIHTLLECEANIYATDIRKWTALHYAAYNGLIMIVNFINDHSFIRSWESSQFIM